MFKWLIDKQIRAEIADIDAKFTKLSAKIDAIDSRIYSLTGRINRVNSGRKLKQPSHQPKLDLNNLRPDEQEFLTLLPENERNAIMQKLNNGGDDEESEEEEQ